MTTTERNIHFGLLGVSLAVAVWVFGAQPHSTEPATRSGAQAKAAEERSPVSIIPPGSAFLLSADLHELTRSPLGAFIAERLGRSAGSGKFVQLCGFDPLARLSQLALAIPSANLAAREHPEDFGIVASGQFSAQDITRCANAAIAARSGEAIRTKLGSFESVRDRQASSGEIAARDGLVVVSGGSYFRELLDSAESGSAKNKGSSAADKNSPDEQSVRDPRHAELRRALGPGALLATWLLGDGWFQRIAGDDTNPRLSPLSALRTIGARLNVAQTAQLSVLLECEGSEGATRISSLLSELRSSLDALPLNPALAGLAARIAVSQTGARLKLQLELNQAELSPVLDALLGL